ncbi:MAG TPA: glycosyltransferase family 2 protein [Vicinamibacterales bacterium]
MPIRPEAARVAVVIVNYQSYDELHACLRSLEQACGALSVVVIDHDSDRRAADALSRTFPHVRVERKDGNHGFAAGINNGARESTSPFLLLLNPDCVLEKNACCELADWMEAHPEVGAAGPRIRNADGTVQPSARRFPDLTTAIAGRSSWLTRVLPGNPMSRRNLPARDPSIASAVEVDWVSGACMLVRREAFNAIGGMDEGFFLYWEDADFCRRLKQAGWRTIYLPSAGATHIGGRSSRHAADASLEAFHRSAYRLYRKHAGPAAQLLSPLVFVGLRARLALMKRIVRRQRSTHD